MYINVLALFGGSSSIFSVWKVKDLLVDANFTCYTKVICAAVVGAREAFKKNVFLFYLYAVFLLFSSSALQTSADCPQSQDNM